MNSNLPKFYQKSVIERLTTLLEMGALSKENFDLLLAAPSLKSDVANGLIENQITQFVLPLGVALNFIIDGDEKIIPLVTEEPSVVAACSNGAKFMRTAGGFTTSINQRTVIGQIILHDLEDFTNAETIILNNLQTLHHVTQLAHPSIYARGGGVKKISTKIFTDDNKQNKFLTIYFDIDVKDAMGANIVNTILEGTAPKVSELLNSTPLMSILSNYNDHALVTSKTRVAINDLHSNSEVAKEIAKKIVAATDYANIDPYRAATHNKGIMNGIDAIILATGNDTRAVSAGIHAYACRSGQYQSLSAWKISKDYKFLEGELTVPMVIGTVGGAISILPIAQASLQLLNNPTSEELARIVVSIGLAQNFAALKALVTDGIQKGHMGLHARSLAIHAGASGKEIDYVANKLRKSEKINSKTAEQLLLAYRSNNS